MINGIILGLMTYGSLVLTFMKLPQRLRAFIQKHEFWADLTAGVLIYLILGTISKTITAVVGAIFAGILVGITLSMVNKKNDNR
jgi:hypothetical protein